LYSKGNTIFWAIIACLLWSTAYASIKIGLQYDTPLHFAGSRFIISGLIILPFTVKPGTYFNQVKQYWKIIASITILQTLINYSLFYIGMSLVPGALGAIIVGSQPLVTAVVASIMQKEDKLNRKKIVAETTLNAPLFVKTSSIPFRVLPSVHIFGYLGALAAIIWNWPNIRLTQAGLKPRPLARREVTFS